MLVGIINKSYQEPEACLPVTSFRVGVAHVIGAELAGRADSNRFADIHFRPPISVPSSSVSNHPGVLNKPDLGNILCGQPGTGRIHNTVSAIIMPVRFRHSQAHVHLAINRIFWSKVQTHAISIVRNIFSVSIPGQNSIWRVYAWIRYMAE